MTDHGYQFRPSLLVPLLISLVAMGATLWAYTWVHIWYFDAVDYINYPSPGRWIVYEGRWLNFLLFPLLKQIGGSIALYLNLLCLFLFAYTAARRYIEDSAYAIAFAALCLAASPWVHQLAWPSITLPGTAMLAAAALSVRALPIYIFYALFGSLFSGSLQHLYYLLPLLHLPLLKGITFISNFRMLTMHVVPAWIVGFLIGHLVMLVMVYISTFLGLGSGQMGVVIEEWRRTNPYTGDRHHAVENLDAMVANTISSIDYLIEHVKILLLLDTTYAWVVLLVGAGALVLCVSSGRRHLPAKLLSLGIILAHFVAVIPVGIHILFRTSTPLAIGIAALLFLTPQVRLRHRMLVGQMVLLSCLTVAWSTQSINTLSWRASITNTYYDELLQTIPMDPKRYAGIVLLSDRSTMVKSHKAIERLLGLSVQGFSVEDMGMTSPLRWKAVAVEAGFSFRDVLLCGRNERDESSAICREIIVRLPLPPVATERAMRRSGWLYTVLGKHRNYLVVSINMIHGLPAQPEPNAD